jgi:type II secretory pathway component GspD/PulD (secretin)
MKKATIFFVVLFLFIGTLPQLAAAQESANPQMMKEIVKVNYIDARSAYTILQPYMSRIGKLQLVRESNMLIIEDIPEIVEKILMILEEIDVKPLDLQFTVDLIVGSMTSGSPAGTEEQVPYPDVKISSDPLIKELSKLLRYKSFKRMDSTLINVQDNTRSTQRLGGAGMSFKLNLHPRYIKEQSGDSIRVDLSLSSTRFKQDGSPLALTLIETTISLDSGDRSVVGVSKLNGGDKALILILSGVVKK